MWRLMTNSTEIRGIVRAARRTSGGKRKSKGDAMRVNRVAGVFVALGISALSLAVCRAQDEPAGQLLKIQTNVGTGYNCGRASSPLYCYGIPVNMGSASGGNGTLWLDTYVTGAEAGTGFVQFNGVADLGEGHVTSNVPTTNSSGQVTKLVVNFNGVTNDGDNGTYTGSMTLTFTYYYSSGGGGRGGAGAGWRFICTGGNLQIAYH
jgi:hypothetical protein